MNTTEEPNIAGDQVKKRFRAYLTMHGERTLLGYFQSAEDAAIARTQSAQHYVQCFLDHD